MRRVPINEFLAQSRKALLLDVRSPAEYNHAHLPGAVSFPLFTNEERAVVGTAYKQKSREAAIKIGLDYFGPKMRGMVEKVEDLIGNKQLAIGNDGHCPLPVANCVFVYCWRGGMRSDAVGWLLNLYGFNVTVLAGGYKAYRNHVLKSFEQTYDVNILGGYTGSGKTELLRGLKAQGRTVIDLEALASHKGSAFGNINMPPQPSQEMFENLLGTELLNVNDEGARVNKEPVATPFTIDYSPPTVWLEDESQRIGTVNIPNGLWKTMRSAPLYFLDIPFEERLAHIMSEYGGCDKEKLIAAVERIKKRLGGLDAKNATQFLTEGKTEEGFTVLLRYYDRQYAKALHNRESLSSVLTTVPCQTVGPQNATALLRPQHTR